MQGAGGNRGRLLQFWSCTDVSWPRPEPRQQPWQQTTATGTATATAIAIATVTATTTTPKWLEMPGHFLLCTGVMFPACLGAPATLSYRTKQLFVDMRGGFLKHSFIIFVFHAIFGGMIGGMIAGMRYSDQAQRIHNASNPR